MDFSEKTISRIRNEKTKKYLFEKFKEAFKTAGYLLAEGIELLNICEDKDIPLDSVVKIVFHYLYIKGLNHFWGIFLLCKEGLGDQSSILLRVLLELLINMKYIGDDENKAKRFADYEFAARKKQLNVVEKHSSLVGINVLESWLKNKPGIETGFNRFKQDYITDRRQLESWSGKKISQIAKDSEMEKDYDLVYKYMSLLVHSSPGIAQRYMETGTKLRLKPGPREDLIYKLLLSGCSYFLDLMKKWESSIGLGEVERLKQAENTFLRVFGKEIKGK